MKKRLLPILISLGFLASLAFIFVSPPPEVRADIYNSSGQVNWNSVYASSITSLINGYTSYYLAATTAITSEKNSRAASDVTYAASATGNTFHEATLRSAADTAIGVAYNLAITNTVGHTRGVLVSADAANLSTAETYTDTAASGVTNSVAHVRGVLTTADTTAAASMTATVSHVRGVLETADSTNAALVNSTANVTHNKLKITNGITAGYFNQITGTVPTNSVGGAFIFKYPGAVTTNTTYGEIRINNNSYIFPIWLKP